MDISHLFAQAKKILFGTIDLISKCKFLKLDIETNLGNL